MKNKEYQISERHHIHTTISFWKKRRRTVVILGKRVTSIGRLSRSFMVKVSLTVLERWMSTTMFGKSTANVKNHPSDWAWLYPPPGVLQPCVGFVWEVLMKERCQLLAGAEGAWCTCYWDIRVVGLDFPSVPTPPFTYTHATYTKACTGHLNIARTHLITLRHTWYLPHAQLFCEPLCKFKLL